MGESRGERVEGESLEEVEKFRRLRSLGFNNKIPGLPTHVKPLR